MRAEAYIAGVLDTLVKAGAVSHGYAAGLVDGLSKQADWAPWADSPQQNYWEAVQDYAEQHPERVAGGRFEISPDEAAKLIDDSRHWYTGGLDRLGTLASNRLRKWTRWLPGRNMTAAMYDRELEDSRNRFRRDYMRQLMQDGWAINPQVAAAVQDKHYRDAKMRMADARRTMGPAAAYRAGYTDDYAESFRTQQGDAAIASGQYKPVYDTKNPAYAPGADDVARRPPRSMYGGEEMRRRHGANAGLFAANRRHYF